MAIYDVYRRKSPSKIKQLIPNWLSDLWNNLWWKNDVYGNHDIVFGGEHYIKKTFKTGNLALIIAIGTLITFLIYIL